MKDLSIKKIIIWTLIAILLTGIVEFFAIKNDVRDSIDVIVCVYHFCIFGFISLFFSIGPRKLSKFIIDNRYVLSIILCLLLTVMGYLLNSYSIIEWLLKTDVPLCLWFNIKFFAIALVSYELMLIITKCNTNISIVMAAIIALSNFVLNNMTKIDAFIITEIFVVLFAKIIDLHAVKSGKLKIIITSIALIVLSIINCYTYRPYAVSFAYVACAMIIWIICENFKTIKENKSLCVNIICVLVASIVLPVISNLIYAGTYFEYEEFNFFGVSYLLDYVYGYLLPFFDFKNKEFVSSMLCLYPLPMIYALIYLYKNDDHIKFLFPMVLLSAFLTVIATNVLPGNIVGIVLPNSGIFATIPAIAFVNVLLMAYIISNVEKRILKITPMIFIVEALIIVMIYIKLPVIISSRLYSNFNMIEMTLLGYLFLNYKDKRYLKVLLFFLVAYAMIPSLFINF